MTNTWEFPKIRGTILGVPIIRTIVFGGPMLGSPYFGRLLHILERDRVPRLGF